LQVDVARRIFGVRLNGRGPASVGSTEQGHLHTPRISGAVPMLILASVTPLAHLGSGVVVMEGVSMGVLDLVAVIQLCMTTIQEEWPRGDLRKVGANLWIANQAIGSLITAVDRDVTGTQLLASVWTDEGGDND
jgi:hypothetical protein